MRNLALACLALFVLVLAFLALAGPVAMILPWALLGLGAILVLGTVVEKIQLWRVRSRLRRQKARDAGERHGL